MNNLIYDQKREDLNPSAPAAQIWANFVFEYRLLSPGLTYKPPEGMKIKPDRFPIFYFNFQLT